MLTESQPEKGLQPLPFLIRSSRVWELTPTSPKLGPTGSHPASDNAPCSCDRLETTNPNPPPVTESQTLPRVPSLNPQRPHRTPTTVNSNPKLAPDLPPAHCPRNPANALLSVCPSLTGVPGPLSSPGHGQNFPGSLAPHPAAIPRFSSSRGHKEHPKPHGRGSLLTLFPPRQ